ncbi:MAG: type IV pilus twitching motility protein PilT [Candidatus Sericytochromatia bacterium]
MIANDWVDNFDKILALHVTRGIVGLEFRPNKKLIICKSDHCLENPQIDVTPEMIENIVKRLISTNQDRDINTVDHHDILQVLGGVLDYDVVIDAEGGGFDTKTFKVHLHSMENEQIRLEFKMEPDILLGYPKTVNPAHFSEEQIINWLDDFGTRMMSLKEPKPKDLIFHPNKRNPYITVTGGLRTIKDVHIPDLGKPTEKIARALIQLAQNAAVETQIAKNEGSLDTLDLDLAYRTKAGRRFRVNIADTFDWESEHSPLITMRLLPEKPFTLEELGIPPAIRNMVFNLKMGLVLICGTTGSGKSTTMCAIIDFLLKNKSINFLTIENPIETIFPSHHYPKSVISQRDVGKHSRSQPVAMESAVRQSLNMAMVGEIRNGHDALMAMELAQSGHLIFATIHAGSVGESVRRVIDMFPPDQEKKMRDMLATQYKMGLSQILVKGVKGQTELVLEIMKTNSDIKALINNTQDPDRRWSMREILELNHKDHGTLSLDQCLVDLFKQGRINEDILMFNSPDPDALRYRQNKLDIKLSSKWDPAGADLEQTLNVLDVSFKEEKEREELEKHKKKVVWDPLEDFKFNK